MADPIRVLLVDDHTVLRAGLRMLINAERDMEVVGEAADGEQAVQQAQAVGPDVVLMDIAMPGLNGLEATRRIRQCCPRARVLMLSMHDDEAYLREALEAGATGYTLKQAADTELLAAIRAVARDEIFLHPTLTRLMVGELLGKRAQTAAGGGRGTRDILSDREREVLRQIALGYTNQQVADMLGLSVKTVETYKARVMEKLHLRTRAALVRYAVERGLLAGVQ